MLHNFRLMTPLLLACLMATASSRISSDSAMVSYTSESSTASALHLQQSLFIAQERSSVWQQQLIGDLHVSHRALQSGGFDICSVLESGFSGSGLTCTCSTDSTTGQTTLACVADQAQCQTLDGATYCSKATVDYIYGSDFQPIESKTCVIDYTIDNVSQNDFCTTITFCPMNSTISMTNMTSSYNILCGCSLSIGGTDCNECSICQNGLGIQLDCTNVEQGATSNCSAYTASPNPSNGGGGGSVFYPNFGEGANPSNSTNGDWCTALSDIATWGGVTCQCTEDNATDTATFSCVTTNGTECAGDSSWQICANVSASVTFVSGELDRIQSCADVNNPQNYEEMCVYATFCSDGTGDLCDVNVTYGGNPCSIEYCSGNQSFSVDCSSSDPRAIIDTCQSANAGSLVAFVPLYQQQQQISSSPAPSTTVVPVPPSATPMTATTGTPTTSPQSAVPIPPPPTDVAPTASPTQSTGISSETPTTNPNEQTNDNSAAHRHLHLRGGNLGSVFVFATGVVLVFAGL